MSGKRNEGRPPGGRSESDGPITDRAAGGRTEPATTGGRMAGGRMAGGRKGECDNTDFGQAAGAPGGRGGTTPFGGVERVKPRTGA